MNIELEFLTDEIKSFFNSVKKIFKYKAPDKKEKKIIIAGGWGYGNTGDEAQCSEILKIFSKRYPKYQIINFTPQADYSAQQHPKYFHSTASRVLFFNQGLNCNCFDLGNSKLKRIAFLLKSVLIYLNALFVRANLPTFFINANVSKILYELKTASLFVFGGGGYLTGKTLSRLWDGILLSRLCYLFKTPVIMSGQTIGIWDGKFNQMYAKWGFKHVDIITVRDEEFSLADLAKINKKGENIFPTHDDALYCEKSNEKQIEDENYITLNFHYWGMAENEKRMYIKKINKIVNYVITKRDYKIVFIPMHPTDRLSFDDYIKLYPNERFYPFEYDYDFRKIKRTIADSKLCITMKHHPIIFAMGENIPVISLAFSSYYIHKNLGALKQYGMENFSINFEDENYFNQFVDKFIEIEKNRENILKTITNRKEILNQRKEKFLKMTDEILNRTALG